MNDKHINDINNNNNMLIFMFIQNNILLVVMFIKTYLRYDSPVSTTTKSTGFTIPAAKGMRRKKP